MTYDVTLRVCGPVNPAALMAAVVQAAGGRGRVKRKTFGDITMLRADAPACRVSVHYPTQGGIYPAEPAPGDRLPPTYAVVLLVSGSGRRQQERQLQAVFDIGRWLEQRETPWAWCDPQDGGRWIISGRSAGQG